jgi:hypothetical protein
MALFKRGVTRNKGSWNSLAASRGARDGKGEKPSESWPANSVPFLSELNTRAVTRAQNLILSTRNALNNSVIESIQRDDQLRLLAAQGETEELRMEVASNRVKIFQEVVDGYKEENTVGKFARIRSVPDFFYYPVLVLLAAGEVFLTAPALVKLFGDIEFFAWTVAIAVGFLTVVGAHIIGLSLKLRLDRQRPQEGWVIKMLYPFSAILLLAVIVIGYVRSAQALDALQKFNIIQSDIGKRIFLICFFVLLQLAFIAVAIMLSFLHYSKSEHDLKDAKREYKKIRKTYDDLMKRFQALASKSFITQELVDIEREKLLSSIKLIEAEYLAACSVYVDGNIHARRDELNGAHVSLIPPTFSIEVDDFSDLKTIAIKTQPKIKD